MLKLKYLYENYDLAKAALEYWEYDTDTLEDHLRHFRISSNAVYPFSWQGNMRFLRLSPAPEKMEKNLRGELEFLRYLQNRRYPAVIPVVSNSGELVVTLDTVWGKYYASVFKGVGGIPMEDTDCNGNILFAYGKALGQLHVLSTGYASENRKWTYRDALLWSENVLKEYGAPKKMLLELDAVRQALRAFPQTSDTFGLVHYDFEPDNVFWDEHSQCCTAIDFEDGMYHFFLVDLEQALDALLENIPADRHSMAKNTFLRGYQSVKSLEPDYAEKLKLMRRFCNLYAYARLIHCVGEEYSNEPDWMVGLREKLRWKIELLESGIAG
ncbi:MAG: phosphotransferase [Oscillospiraceae bacterium]|nr:phosphotransferase [Oscillospiraceae bacterium]